MKDYIFPDIPRQYKKIARVSKKLEFNMASDLYTGSLLKTLVASKPSGRILELGTGSGLATSWILSGMSKNAKLVTVDNNDILLDIAKESLSDPRIKFVLSDGYEWIKNYKGEKFDLVFADAIPGKYDLLDETLALVKVGGFYIIDDMKPQPNWPAGHSVRVKKLIATLEEKDNLTLTKMNWSTGILIITKIAE
jgi:predicted O-methyltransferase YrrM